jgi:hypothetical protein
MLCISPKGFNVNSHGCKPGAIQKMFQPRRELNIPTLQVKFNPIRGYSCLLLLPTGGSSGYSN